MEKHPRRVEGFNGSLDDLAKAVGNMAYDQAACFIEKLAEDIRRQADCDLAGGRKNLSGKLYGLSEKLYEAKDLIDEIWKICKPYMNEKINDKTTEKFNYETEGNYWMDGF